MFGIKGGMSIFSHYKMNLTPYFASGIGLNELLAAAIGA